VYVFPAAARLSLELNREGSHLIWLLLGWLMLVGLVLAFVVLWAVLRLLGVWSSSHPWFDGLFHGLLALILALDVLFVAGYAGLVIGAIRSDWSILIVGLPPMAPWVLSLAWLAAGLTVLWIALLAVGWLRRAWPLWRRGLYVLLAAVPLAFLWAVMSM